MCQRGRNQNTRLDLIQRSKTKFEKFSMSRPAVILPTARLDPRFGDKFEYANTLPSKIVNCELYRSKQFCAMSRLRLSKSSTAPLRKDQQNSSFGFSSSLVSTSVSTPVPVSDLVQLQFQFKDQFQLRSQLQFQFQLRFQYQLSFNFRFSFSSVSNLRFSSVSDSVQFQFQFNHQHTILNICGDAIYSKIWTEILL